MSISSYINSPIPVYSIINANGTIACAVNGTPGAVTDIYAIQTLTDGAPIYQTLTAGTYLITMKAKLTATDVDATMAYAQLFALNGSAVVYARTGTKSISVGATPAGSLSYFNESVRVVLSSTTALTLELQYSNSSHAFSLTEGELSIVTTV